MANNSGMFAFYMKGILFVIEASDSCGKQTQTEKLFQRLMSEKYDVRRISFPNYNSPSSALVKMYLSGEFGVDPIGVNPFAASSFYTVDRYASYVQEWKDFYENGGIVISDRYTTSNMIHQAVKIEEPNEKEIFLNWLYDFEFNKIQLPVPDKVFFLDMPPDFSEELMRNRANKFGAESKDIHERNHIYLRKCYDNSCSLVKKYGWKRIECVYNGELKTIEKIHEEIYSEVKKVLY